MAESSEVGFWATVALLKGCNQVEKACLHANKEEQGRKSWGWIQPQEKQQGLD